MLIDGPSELEPFQLHDGTVLLARSGHSVSGTNGGPKGLAVQRICNTTNLSY